MKRRPLRREKEAIVGAGTRQFWVEDAKVGGQWVVLCTTVPGDRVDGRVVISYIHHSRDFFLSDECFPTHALLTLLCSLDWDTGDFVHENFGDCSDWARRAPKNTFHNVFHDVFHNMYRCR